MRVILIIGESAYRLSDKGWIESSGVTGLRLGEPWSKLDEVQVGSKQMAQTALIRAALTTAETSQL